MEYQAFLIDKQAEEQLGIYIYALIDPRDQKVFYIGQGRRNRIDGHFGEARSAIQCGEAFTSKTRRIQNIWEEGLKVQIQIIRHNLSTQAEADHSESSCIAVLGLSQNGVTYNLNAGPKSVGHGNMSIDDVEMLNAQPVDPDCVINQVFVFNSNSDQISSDELYASVRGNWNVTENNRSVLPSYAVVLSRGVSQQIYKISKWEQSGDKFRFVGSVDDEHSGQMIRKNWSSIIGATLGFWQRGQYIIVNFNGRGKFQFVRGLQSDEWFDLRS